MMVDDEMINDRYEMVNMTYYYDTHHHIYIIIKIGFLVTMGDILLNIIFIQMN